LVEDDEAPHVQLSRWAQAGLDETCSGDQNSAIQGFFGRFQQSFFERAMDLFDRVRVTQRERERIEVDLAQIAFVLFHLGSHRTIDRLIDFANERLWSDGSFALAARTAP
jgi:hypothetical protein